LARRRGPRSAVDGGSVGACRPKRAE
jgi:hypothetical protein